MNFERWIRELIAAGQEVKFYKHRAWRTLRMQVLEKYHFECQDCLLRGKYKRAVTVHHVNELKHRPDLALCEYYTDSNGEQQINLKPLCHDCHDAAHERMRYTPKPKPLNAERW